VRCGPQGDGVVNPEPGELVRRSCDRVDYQFGTFGEDWLSLSPYPLAPRGGALAFVVPCPHYANADGFTPCTPRIELRRGFGHGRLLGDGVRNIPRAAASPSRVRVRLTRLGRRLIRRPHGVIATVSLGGRSMPVVGWTIHLRRP
jgi:hypothetical protein